MHLQARMFALEKSVSADDFSLRSDDVRPFPFLPSPILPTPLSVEDAGKRMEELRCGLVGNFSIAPSEHAPCVLASPTLTESCNPVVAAASRTERARSPSLSAPCIKTRREARVAAEVGEAVEAERARKWMIGRSIGCTPAHEVRI